MENWHEKYKIDAAGNELEDDSHASIYCLKPNQVATHDLIYKQARQDVKKDKFPYETSM